MTTSGPGPMPGVEDPRQLLHDAGTRLAERFTGHFAPETIERYLFESYAALRRTSRLTAFLPVLAETFARERLTALAQHQGSIARDVPEVLLVCEQNAGRSQMAAALIDRHAAGSVHVRSAGSQPAAEVGPEVVAVMGELGIDLADAFPKPLTDDVVRAADVVVTMGCGDACPIYPGRTYLDWDLADPAGRPLDEVRAIRDEIDARARDLVATVLAHHQEGASS
ncbi:three-helix bundle dimerization domain-containing protein [Nocardioides sp. CFH 31398]|uniref:arsenate reductase/protein-tyrosine-phosphatase family protein n=1 Tax=Nocardioides sp. CFH 31398 TaxID=2919579 RepID=UPI001F06DDBF|nr:arsenate reductase ArsC [Nocardioides sp. CFH 31398]MCH1865523.1 arsenate reductase ArsC [Nocardioides sp. CFH 31398]